MGFADQVKAFTAEATAAIEVKQEELRVNAERVLHETLGPDVSKVESIRLDADVGKFHSVVAPDDVIAKLRAANLLRE